MKQGNKYTGNIDKLNEIIFISRVEDNLVIGFYNEYKVQIKLFSKDSKYGINEGRISTLIVYSPETNVDYISYDRGWDVEPKTTEMKTLLENILKATE